MISTRTRLTILFGVAAVAVAAALAIALLLARSSYVYQDLGRHASMQAEMATRLIERTEAAGDSVTVESGAGSRVLAGQLRRLLDASPDFLIVLDTAGAPLFTSRAVAALPTDEWTTMQNGLEVIPDNGPGGLVPVGGGVLFVGRAVGGRPAGVARVLAGVRTSEALGIPREYAVTLGFVLPLVILTSIWGAYLLLARPFDQLDRIATEVAAITDGTSLHRRLAMQETRGELSRMVTTLNAMIGRLESSFAALRRFTADASHELKTPLTVLRADVERAMSDRASPGEKAVALEEALHETTRMADLVESLLTLARADEGRLEVVREPVDLGALAQDVYETAVILGEASGVTVTMPFTAEVAVMGDRARLRQLFLNLVTNAIKYTQPSGRVDIGLGRHPEHVAFVVRDTGIGISAADLPHVFDRFWRADRARSRTAARDGEHGGFGLGLAISQWIAQAHGGTLTVSSRLGMGSLFTVTLPLAPEERADVELETEEATAR